MYLKNNSTGKTIIEKVRFANGFFSNMKGLMFESEKNFDYALIFPLPYESRIGASVHMMFVFFPIDIIFLDSKKHVVDKATLVPWMLNYTPKKPAKYFIEMQAGKASMAKIGDMIGWS